MGVCQWCLNSKSATGDELQSFSNFVPVYASLDFPVSLLIQETMLVVVYWWKTKLTGVLFVCLFFSSCTLVLRYLPLATKTELATGGCVHRCEAFPEMRCRTEQSFFIFFIFHFFRQINKLTYAHYICLPFIHWYTTIIVLLELFYLSYSYAMCRY